MSTHEEIRRPPPLDPRSGRVTVVPRRLIGIAFLSVAWLEAASSQTEEPSGVLLPEGQALLSAGTALEKRVYTRPAPPDQAAVVIRGEGFAVDFRGAVLQGADPTRVPASDFKGIIFGSKTGEFRGEETLLCKETARPHNLVVPYAFPKGDYRHLRLVNDEVVDWVHLEEFEVFLWPKILEEYFSGGIGIRNTTKDRVDARGNSWIPEASSPDKISQKANADSGEVLTGPDSETIPPLPEMKGPDLPGPKSEWRLPREMPHGRDKIVLDDWGPVVPKGWME